MKKKKQHYVPKFLLRNFSIGNDGKRIGIYNKNKKLFLPKVGLRNQAYEDYFYGKDGQIEEFLAIVESSVSATFKELDRNWLLPPSGSKSYTDLWFYTFLQESRTKYSFDEKKEMMNKFLDHIGKYDDALKERITREEPASIIEPKYVLDRMFKGLYMAEDLACKLIINSTNEPFIISDNPVVKNNQFLEKRNQPGGLCGIISKGLQVFFPIHPNLCLHFYDRSTYRVGNRKNSEVTITSTDDICEINMLQVLFSDENIFFNESCLRRQLDRLMKRSEKYIITERSVIQESKERKLKDGSRSRYVHTFRNEPRPKMKLSFVTETKKAKKYKLDGWSIVLRKEEWRRNGFLDKRRQ